MKLAAPLAFSLVSLGGTCVAQSSSFPTFVDVPVAPPAAGYGWNTITVDRLGNRYVTERWQYWIRKITPDGAVTTLAGDPGEHGTRDGNGPNARFSAPAGYLALAADDQGDIFVADTYNNTIRKITPDGRVTTIAGQPGVFASVDGPLSQARFNWPSAIAFGPGGTLYVADSGRIRTISPDGMVATLAGGATTSNESVDGVGAEARLFSGAASRWIGTGMCTPRLLTTPCAKLPRPGS